MLYFGCKRHLPILIIHGVGRAEEIITIIEEPGFTHHVVIDLSHVNWHVIPIDGDACYIWDVKILSLVHCLQGVAIALDYPASMSFSICYLSFPFQLVHKC